MPIATIPLDARVRDRLRAYGTPGMTYEEIVTRLMDDVDRRRFLAATRRRLARVTDNDLEDLE